MTTITRQAFIDAIEAGIAAAQPDLSDEFAAKLREHARTAARSVVGCYELHAEDGAIVRCPWAAIVPDNDYVADFPGERKFIEAFDAALIDAAFNPVQIEAAMA
jgi:hypothetical protein